MTIENARAWAEKLNSLDVDGLHKLMRDHNIKGVKNSPSGCLIAEFMFTETAVYTCVGTRELRMFADGELPGMGEGVPLAEGVRDFIRMFDDGLLPSLEVVDGYVS